MDLLTRRIPLLLSPLAVLGCLYPNGNLSESVRRQATMTSAIRVGRFFCFDFANLEQGAIDRSRLMCGDSHFNLTDTVFRVDVDFYTQ